MIPIVISALGTIKKGLLKGLNDKNQRASRDHRDYTNIKISETTEESPRDLMPFCLFVCLFGFYGILTFVRY